MILAITCCMERIPERKISVFWSHVTPNRNGLDILKESIKEHDRKNPCVTRKRS